MFGHGMTLRGQQNLPVDRWEEVPLVTVEGGALLPDVDGLPYLASEPVLLSLQHFGVNHAHGVPGVGDVFSYRCRIVLFSMFFEPLAKCSLGFPDVRPNTRSLIRDKDW